MYFSLIKEINRSLKETNRLLSKAMPISYLKVNAEKKWRTQNFDLEVQKVLRQISFWGVPTHADTIEF